MQLRIYKTFMPALACLCAAASCNREAEIFLPSGEEGFKLGFSISGAALTKAIDGKVTALQSLEDEHDRVDIFLFDAVDGTLKYQQHWGSEDMEVARGTYHVYVVANLDKTASGTAYSSISREADLAGATVSYGHETLPGDLCSAWGLYHQNIGNAEIGNYADGDYHPAYFVMSAPMQEVLMAGNRHLEFNLERVVSKIVVHDAFIRVDGAMFKAGPGMQGYIDNEDSMGNEWLLYGEGEYYSAFTCALLNMPKSAPLFRGGTEPSASADAAKTFNPGRIDFGKRNCKSGWQQPEFEFRNELNYNNWLPETASSRGGISLSGRADYEYSEGYTATSFYCFPNTAPALSDAERVSGGSARDYVTKVVIALPWAIYEFDDKEEGTCLFYYSIGIQGIGRNEVYEINSVDICGWATEDPNAYPPVIPSISASSYSIEVKDWTSGKVEKIITGGKGSVDSAANVTI